MSFLIRSWLPQRPVVPPKLWLTAAAAIIAGLGIIFRMEIWPGHPKAHLWNWIVLGILLQAGSIQLIKMLRSWVRQYHGPGLVRLLLWGAVLPVYGVAGLLIAGFALFVCFNLGSILMK
ncbi:hypothetical protein KB206_07425 [Microvirga sp. STS02]|uniref:hypothetical protein n=1 Tax=Hymenobacter negativus TaxID=2795026 RepID=UPI0018DB8D25|nr:MULTISPECIES: hypothetical protein [Bacteria]MBH8568705.1 hypothetical protein [Hymenobacter negativus]MBR7208439.1 hypothetical protein [Microvirga sp. STS02]